jgi:hypothetical protein
METAKNRFQCRHIFTAGRCCKAPCLRQQDLCYFHQTSSPSTWSSPKSGWTDHFNSFICRTLPITPLFTGLYGPS